jgi:CTD small phosphatase-like protein 2
VIDQTAIFIRPYAKEILQVLSQHFELIVFTASHKGYADKVIDLLDPERKYITHRLFRDHCFKTKQGVYVKDLRILNRSLEKMVLVDNAMYSFALQLTNGVPIIPFNDSKADQELQHLSSFLLKLRHVDDVRPIIHQHFRYDLLVQAKDVQECIDLMFAERK